MPYRKSGLLGLVFLFFVAGTSVAIAAESGGATVEAQVVVNHVHGKSSHSGNADVVVWLTPLGADPRPLQARARRYQMVQKNKQFHPHVLAVPVGAPVEFPNEDPWFHNVFSLYKGAKFDLGLYEAGSSRTVRFDHPGVSFIFCNIHPEMSAYVLALTTPYFAVSNDQGQVRIANVVPGRYRIEVWFERAESPEMAKLSREVTVSEPTTSIGKIEVRESPLAIPPHTDMHGQPYYPDRAPY